MFTQDDEEQRYGVWAAFGAVVLVIVLVLGVAISKTGLFKKKPATAVTTNATAPADTALTGEPLAQFFFATGQQDLPADAAAGIAKIAHAVTSGSGAKVLISGFHDETGDALINAEIAKSRAKAVRDALKAQGVQEDRMVMRKPEAIIGTEGSGDNAQARRVDVRVQ
jgi:outer membrane protein OmpA-like peptidoglycan-associated protein